MIFCNTCVYPMVAATALTADDEGKCSGCKVSEQRETINWDRRLEEFKKLIDRYRSNSDYDVVIPVSGGKDSYFQVHFALEHGLRPLLVTYHGDAFTSEGEKNLQNMRRVFDCDHLIYRPSSTLLKRLNRIGFKLQGDNNWHNHAGIFTYPIQVAVKHRIPIILWGEHGFMDIAGMYSYNDYVEFTAKYRYEHCLHGFDWFDFTDEGLEKNGRSDIKEGISEKELVWLKYPSDTEIDDVGVRGIYLSNYIKWSGSQNADLVESKYGWKPFESEQERTYRKISNLDDIHENGIHDYMKFIKFGYGRATDHASKDIRDGLITRDKGIEYVNHYDHVKPMKSLNHWLEYVQMKERDFDEIADSFRDPRVWFIRNGKWVKDCIDGELREFGDVLLEKKQREKYKELN